MNRDEALQARREGARAEFWDAIRGGWHRGIIRTIHRDRPTVVVLETGKTRGTTVNLEKLRREG